MKNAKLRIIGGKFRGRKITFNSGNLSLRPSLDRVRETVFNWLSPFIFNNKCLDLFAGSGIFGFEALSRGAKIVYAVDNNFDTCKHITDNVKTLNCNQLIVIHEDVQVFLNNYLKLPLVHVKFNLVFLDPPYLNRKLLLDSLSILVDNNLIEKNCKIYVECYKDPDIFSEKFFPQGLQLLKSSQTSKIGFYLLEKY